MKFYYTIFLIWMPIFSLAQKIPGAIHFIPTLNQEGVELGKKYYVDNLEDSIRIEALKFYIGHLQFYQADKKVDALDTKYLLIDAEDPTSLQIAIPQDLIGSFDKIRFNLGVDSLTSVSGVFGGDLDPANGMYWTWQSGYINVKLEGTADRCPARKHAFQFHLGGYQAPFYTLQEVELSLSGNPDIALKIPLDQFLEQVDLMNTYQIMSPNVKALEAARKFASLISLSP